MAARGLSGRFVCSALLGGPLLIAGVAWAAPAQADEASYLNHLHAVGIRDVEGGDPELVAVGQNICTQVSWGASAGQLQGLALQRSDTTLGSNGLNPTQADALVDYAIADLCPSLDSNLAQ